MISSSPRKMRLRHLILAGVMATSGTLGLDMSSCARSCYAATVYFLGCNPDDVACVCKQQPNLMYYAEPCLAQECRDDNLLCKSWFPFRLAFLHH